MPRRPRPVSYREALSALLDCHTSLHRVLTTPGLPPPVQEQLQLLSERIGRLLARDNGRTR